MADFAALIATVQVAAVPVHAPLQPVKTAPAPGVAVSVTEVPWAKVAEQLVEPTAVGVAQLTPAGEEATVPDTLATDLLAVTVSVCMTALKVAVTARSALSVTVQVVAVPVHAPLQPAKVVPAGAVAVSDTEVPLA